MTTEFAHSPRRSSRRISDSAVETRRSTRTTTYRRTSAGPCHLEADETLSPRAGDSRTERGNSRRDHGLVLMRRLYKLAREVFTEKQKHRSSRDSATIVKDALHSVHRGVRASMHARTFLEIIHERILERRELQEATRLAEPIVSQSMNGPNQGHRFQWIVDDDSDSSGVDDESDSIAVVSNWVESLRSKRNAFQGAVENLTDVLSHDPSAAAREVVSKCTTLLASFNEILESSKSKTVALEALLAQIDTDWTSANALHNRFNEELRALRAAMLVHACGNDGQHSDGESTPISEAISFVATHLEHINHINACLIQPCTKGQSERDTKDEDSITNSNAIPHFRRRRYRPAAEVIMREGNSETLQAISSLKQRYPEEFPNLSSATHRPDLRLPQQRPEECRHTPLRKCGTDGTTSPSSKNDVASALSAKHVATGLQEHISLGLKDGVVSAPSRSGGQMEIKAFLGDMSEDLEDDPVKSTPMDPDFMPSAITRKAVAQYDQQSRNASKEAVVIASRSSNLAQRRGLPAIPRVLASTSDTGTPASSSSTRNAPSSDSTCAASKSASPPASARGGSTDDALQALKTIVRPERSRTGSKLTLPPVQRGNSSRSPRESRASRSPVDSRTSTKSSTLFFDIGEQDAAEPERNSIEFADHVTSAGGLKDRLHRSTAKHLTSDLLVRRSFTASTMK